MITASRPPVPYFGGKQRIAARIAELLPAHRHYVEPFAGSAAVLFAKRPAPFETLNDLDGNLMCFWRVLRERPRALEDACALTPHSRAEHQVALDLPADLPDLERARRVFVALTQGRGGSLRRTGWRFFEKPTGTTSMPDALAGYRARFAAAASRLARVSLESRDALEVVGAYGRHADVLLYVDPPYPTRLRSANSYAHEMGDDQHAQLLAALLNCRAAVVLSGYPGSSLYDDALHGWQVVDLPASTTQGTGPARRVERIWSNRPAPLALLGWRVCADGDPR